MVKKAYGQGTAADYPNLAAKAKFPVAAQIVDLLLVIPND
jgi:hypothetical protein